MKVQKASQVPQNVVRFDARQPTTKGGVRLTIAAGSAAGGNVVHDAASSGILHVDAEL